MKYKAIIYDLDGTLINSKKDIAIATNTTIIQMGGTPLLEKTIYKFVGHGVKELLEGALGLTDEAQQKKAADIFRTFYWNHCLDNTHIYPSVLKTLKKMQALKVPQAIFTNKTQSYTDKIVKGLNLSQFFSIVLGAENGFPIKPAREGTQHILQTLGSTPQETLFVGDSDTDFKTAQNMGMDCCLLLGGFSTKKEILALKTPQTFICKNFGELYQTLFKPDSTVE